MISGFIQRLSNMHPPKVSEIICCWHTHTLCLCIGASSSRDREVRLVLRSMPIASYPGMIPTRVRLSVHFYLLFGIKTFSPLVGKEAAERARAAKFGQSLNMRDHAYTHLLLHSLRLVRRPDLQRSSLPTPFHSSRLAPPRFL